MDLFVNCRAFFVVIFLDKFLGTHQPPMDRQRVQQQVFNSSSSSFLKAKFSPPDEVSPGVMWSFGCWPNKTIAFVHSSFLKMKTVISQ